MSAYARTAKIPYRNILVACVCVCVLVVPHARYCQDRISIVCVRL